MFWLVTLALLLALLMLAGQYLSSQADYFLSIEDPRPLDEEVDVVTIKWWGFAAESTRSLTPDITGQGFADVRIYATRKQVLTSLITFGWKRPVSIAWRGNAGQHPLGDA